MLRREVAAGSFYPADREELLDNMGEMIDKNQEKRRVFGAVLPHAGYIYSGKVAGKVLSKIELPQTAVIIGRNHTGMGKPFSVAVEESWQTPLGTVEVDEQLARSIIGFSRYLEEDSAAHLREHSIEVQLPLLQYLKPDIKIVPVVLTAAAPASAYKEIGQAIARGVKGCEGSVLILASSDMTHYEPHDTARDKDMKIIEAILEMDEDLMLQVVSKYHVSMCGAGPVACLIRAVRELGGGVAELVDYRTSGETTGNYSDVVGYAGIIISPKVLHPLVSLAKGAVETFVKQRQVIKPPAELTPEMAEKAGVFVSLHKGRELRGCIGTFAPAKKNVAEEIIANAINAAMEDPRFSPVSVQELADLDYSVDVLTEPEPVDDESELDPVRYGVIVEAGLRRGLLLPDLEGVNTVEKQIEICRMKAGIGSHEPLTLYRFEVKRFR
ncbi:MAG: AmmeMemoRadiSam system protein B [Dehalococcoidales bacterium]|nr:AmmeMemoRadiSam system protein B [Dehalococcoidales bacterium]